MNKFEDYTVEDMYVAMYTRVVSREEFEEWCRIQRQKAYENGQFDESFYGNCGESQ